MNQAACTYRISAKALITDDEGKFLLLKEVNGLWELPGGGIEFGETPQHSISREIFEEMGVTVESVGLSPQYFFTSNNLEGRPIANVVYPVTVVNLKFTPSEECQELRFFTAAEVLAETNIYPNVAAFAAILQNTTRLAKETSSSLQ